jgi:hypothetical protein
MLYVSHGQEEDHERLKSPLYVHKGLHRMRKPAENTLRLQNTSLVFETRSGEQCEKLILENPFCGLERQYPQWGVWFPLQVANVVMRKPIPDSQTSLSAASACPQEAGRKLAPMQTFFLLYLTCETVPRCCQHSRLWLPSHSALQGCQGCICAEWSHLEIAFVKKKMCSGFWGSHSMAIFWGVTTLHPKRLESSEIECCN